MAEQILKIGSNFNESSYLKYMSSILTKKKFNFVESVKNCFVVLPIEK